MNRREGNHRTKLSDFHCLEIPQISPIGLKFEKKQKIPEIKHINNINFQETN